MLVIVCKEGRICRLSLEMTMEKLNSHLGSGLAQKQSDSLVCACLRHEKHKPCNDEASNGSPSLPSRY